MRRYFILVLLCLSLWSSQMLGVLHSIVHADDAPHSLHSAAQVQAPESGQAEDNFFVRLFSGHASDHDCRSFDHASHCDGMPSVPALTLPLVLLPFVFLALAGLAVARWHAQFQARGPPSLL